MTYVGPEALEKFGERESLNSVLVQERNEFEERIRQIKREKSFEIETDFFKVGGPVSNVRATRYKLRDRSFTTIRFLLDTKSFADEDGDVFLGTVDQMGMNLNAIGYVLCTDPNDRTQSPIRFLTGKFGFVSRASGQIELIYKANKDTDSIFNVTLSYWDALEE